MIVVVNGILGYAVYKSNQKLLDSQHRKQHLAEERTQIDRILSIAKDIENTSRGFIITNNNAFLEPLSTAKKTVFVAIGQLKQLTGNNKLQQQRIDSINIYMVKLLDFSLKMVKLRSEQGLTSTAIYAYTMQGKYYIDHINQIISIIQQDVLALLKQENYTNEHNIAVFNKFLVIVCISIAGFNILLIIAIGKYLLQNKEKENRAAELVIANKELLFQNDEKEKRAEELAIANLELSFQNEERRIAEKNLFQSESRLKEAQAISHIGNFDIDLVKYTDVWSDGMYKIYGIDKGTVTPSIELFLSFIHPDDLEYVTISVNKAYKNCKSFPIDFRFIHESGNIRYGHLEAKFKLSKERSPCRLFGILQDVTELKLAEIERIKMVNDLMLRNSVLEQFAYIISHNLRSPVANIIGASSALNDADLSAGDRDMLNKAINTSVLRLDNVVQDLNLILEIKGSTNETKEVVVFSDLVDDIKFSIKNLVDKYAIKIKYDFSDANEYFTLKPYLYSIFYNLITNSVKYRSQDISTTIKIESHRVNNVLQLVFKDNGMGIDLEKKGDQVFGLYKRFHPEIEGKGMGLYMVKTQVEALGGTIGIKSEENKGTEFVIEFAA